MPRFIRQHAFLGTLAARPLLSTRLFDARSLCISAPATHGLDFFDQQAPRDEAVQSLLARLLAFNLNARRPVEQHYASGGFVHVLAAVTAGPNEGFLEVAFAHACRSHELGKLLFSFWTDGKRAHSSIVSQDRNHRIQIT